MKNQIKTILYKMHHDMAIAELRLQNNGKIPAALTYNDVLYLSLIEAHPGEYTASSIADMLYVSRPAVTQKLNELERRGYIYKEQSKTDKRMYYLFINCSGASKEYYDIIEKTDDEIVKKLSNNYTQEQIDLFCEMAEKICESMLNESSIGE